MITGGPDSVQAGLAFPARTASGRPERAGDQGLEAPLIHI